MWSGCGRILEPFVLRVVDLVTPVDIISRLSIGGYGHIAVVLRVAVGASYKSTKIIWKRESVLAGFDRLSRRPINPVFNRMYLIYGD